MIPIGTSVHVPYFGPGIVTEEVDRDGDPLYRIRHKHFQASVYRLESQFTVLTSPGFREAMIDGIVTRDPLEAERLMRAHITARKLLQDVQVSPALAAKPQFSAQDIQQVAANHTAQKLHALKVSLAYDMRDLDYQTLVQEYDSLIPAASPVRYVAWKRSVHRQLKRLSVKALPAGHAQVIEKQPERVIVLEQPEQEEQAA